jgi:UDP-glucose 4-epimerase
MGIEGHLRYLSPRNEVVHAFADHSRARRVFEMGPPVPLDEGLRRMAAWAKDVGARRGEEFGAIEVTKNLPTVWLED